MVRHHHEHGRKLIATDFLNALLIGKHRLWRSDIVYRNQTPFLTRIYLVFKSYLNQRLSPKWLHGFCIAFDCDYHGLLLHTIGRASNKGQNLSFIW